MQELWIVCKGWGYDQTQLCLTSLLPSFTPAGDPPVAKSHPNVQLPKAQLPSACRKLWGPTTQAIPSLLWVTLIYACPVICRAKSIKTPGGRRSPHCGLASLAGLAGCRASLGVPAGICPPPPIPDIPRCSLGLAVLKLTGWKPPVRAADESVMSVSKSRRLRRYTTPPHHDEDTHNNEGGHHKARVQRHIPRGFQHCGHRRMV